MNEEQSGTVPVSVEDVSGLKKKNEELLAEKKKLKERYEQELTNLSTKLETYETEKQAIERKKKEEAGQYKELLAQIENENSSLKAAKSELEQALEQFKAVEEKRRESLLQSLPEDVRDVYKNATELQIQKYLEALQKEKRDSQTAGVDPIANKEPGLDNMTNKQIQDYYFKKLGFK